MPDEDHIDEADADTDGEKGEEGEEGILMAPPAVSMVVVALESGTRCWPTGLRVLSTALAIAEAVEGDE